MKKWMCILLALAMCFVATSCGKNDTGAKDTSSTNQEATQNIRADYKLIVNGKDIAAGTAFFISHEKQYAEIPLTAALSALGCQVEWANEKSVEIRYNDTVYILNPSEQTLVKSGDSFNFIAVAPGAAHGLYCETLDREFIIDSDSVSYFLSQLGAQITIDYENNTVKIDWKA